MSRPVHVLVVDDRRDILGFARIALERAGYEVAVTDSGRQALELQRRHAADLLITDIFMPEVDGMEIIDRFQREYPRTRIIAMSGGAEHMRDYLGIALQIGVDATLRKPFTVEELLRTVRRVQGAPR